MLPCPNEECMIATLYFLISALKLIKLINEQKSNRTSGATYGIRRSSDGSLNSFVRRGKLRVNPDFEPNVSSTTLMMQIAVEYYLETDVKKASYFQKKLNSLVVKSLNAPSVETKQNVPK